MFSCFPFVTIFVIRERCEKKSLWSTKFSLKLNIQKNYFTQNCESAIQCNKKFIKLSFLYRILNNYIIYFVFWEVLDNISMGIVSLLLLEFSLHYFLSIEILSDRWFFLYISFFHSLPQIRIIYLLENFLSQN